jgi:hypothetical protein
MRRILMATAMIVALALADAATTGARVAAPIGETTQAPTSQFSPAGIDDPKVVDRFLTNLQTAVAADDAAGVAQLARYPAEVMIDKKRRRVRSRPEMEKLYGQIFTPCLKRVVAAAKPEDLFASWQGVNLGQGAIWFGMQANGRILLFSINGPMEDEPLCKEAH